MRLSRPSPNSTSLRPTKLAVRKPSSVSRERDDQPGAGVDPEEVRRLAKLGCTQRDIASHVGCHQSLISKRFSSVYELGVSQCRISLRRLMWKQARGGNATIILRLDDRYYGPVERQPSVDSARFWKGYPMKTIQPRSVQDKILDRLNRSRYDLPYFNRKILYRSEFWSAQQEWSGASVRYRAVAISTGNMLGKGFFLGTVIPWFIWTRKDAVLAYVCGAGQTQIGSTIWKELRRAVQGCPFWRSGHLPASDQSRDQEQPSNRDSQAWLGPRLD